MRVKVLALVIISSVLVWLPFVLRIANLPGWGLDFSGGMETVFANFDGPNYLIVAKSWYDKSFIGLNFSNPLPLEYYPAHLPLYPFLISVFDMILPGTWAMLLVTLLGSLLAFYMLLLFAKDAVGEKKAFWIAMTFLLLPARWLAVRSVGSPEPWFIFFVLASIFYFKKQRYWLAGVFGVLAQWTKSPGILLFGGYVVYFLLEWWRDRKRFDYRKWVSSYPIKLIPLSVIPLFFLYQLRTGDFLAYFHSGDNFHLFFPPFSIFSPQGQFWTGEFWLEEIIWLWLIYGLGILRLWQKGLKVESSFAGVFFASTLFVAHRDIARYILPIAPLMLLGFSELLSSKAFRWLLLLLIIPIYLFTWNFMLNNVAPIGDWTPYL